MLESTALLALPCQRGRIGLLINAWYEPAVEDRLERRCGETAFRESAR